MNDVSSVLYLCDPGWVARAEEALGVLDRVVVRSADDVAARSPPDLDSFDAVVDGCDAGREAGRAAVRTLREARGDVPVVRFVAVDEAATTDGADEVVAVAPNLPGHRRALAAILDGEAGTTPDAPDESPVDGAFDASRTDLQQVYDTIPAMVTHKDTENRLLRVNRAVTDYLDLPREEIEGRTAEELFPGDGEQFYEMDRQVIESGEPLEGVVQRVTTPSGEEKWMRTDQFPYRDADGEITGVLVVSVDITDQKRYERRLERQNETLALLNRIVHHDIRNDVEVSTGTLLLLADHVDAEGERYLEDLLERNRQVVAMTDDVRGLMDATLGTVEVLVPVPLAAVVERQVDELRSSASGARVVVDGEVPRVSVLANDMLGSVFRNLLTNAVQHHDRDDPAVTVSAVADDGWVRVSVADDGPGVPPAIVERVFDEDVKGIESAGTGVGLYLVKTLVDQYGGEVGVEPNDPRGTVFTVELPIAG